MGVGVWGWGDGPHPPIPNPQSPIPNPQSPLKLLKFIFSLLFIHKKILVYIYQLGIMIFLIFHIIYIF
jgi:hypothetical protein